MLEEIEAKAQESLLQFQQQHEDDKDDMEDEDQGGEKGSVRRRRRRLRQAQQEEELPAPGSLELYGRLLESVSSDVSKLRVVLEGAEAKEKERAWLKNQLSGDLDENKIVDGVSGEKRVFRKRGEPERKLGVAQRRPKRVVFAVDCSASMARMNGWDGRLDRMASGVVMLMEALSDPQVGGDAG
jgi:hypothetical protein